MMSARERDNVLACAVRKNRLLFMRNSRDIEWVKQGGRRLSTPLFNLQFRQAGGDETKLAIIVGRRFGTAVRRNRAKRIFRELGRAVYYGLAPGYRLLVFPKTESLATTHDELRQQWRGSLRRCHLLDGDDPAP